MNIKIGDKVKFQRTSHPYRVTHSTEGLFTFEDVYTVEDVYYCYFNHLWKMIRLNEIKNKAFCFEWFKIVYQQSVGFIIE